MPSLNDTLRFDSKPRIFIGSSKKGLPIARDLSRLLESTADCRVWEDGVFGLGKGTLDSLVSATREHDFAILILTADEIAHREGVPLFRPSDNVVFELGLFIGALGKNRTFIVLKQQKSVLALPSDLDGITRADFWGKDLESACKKLRQAIASAVSRVDLTGEWHSAYQRHDPPLGEWIKDKTTVTSRPPQKLIFKNYDDPIGSEYEAVGELKGENEIVGVWREMQCGATARGTFQLYIDRFGKTLYGICTGPTNKGENIYSGWVLVRDDKKLTEAQRDLHTAMLICRFPPQ